MSNDLHLIATKFKGHTPNRLFIILEKVRLVMSRKNERSGWAFTIECGIQILHVNRDPLQASFSS